MLVLSGSLTKEKFTLYRLDAATGRSMGRFPIPQVPQRHPETTPLLVREHNLKLLMWSLSPDGRSLALCQDLEGRPCRGVRVMDLATGRRTFDLGEDRTATFLVQFSPDGKFLATLSARLTPVPGSQAGLFQFRGQSFQAEGPMSLTVWDVAAPKEVRRYVCGPAGEKEGDFSPEFCTFSPDGRLITVVGTEKDKKGPVRLFEVSGKPRSCPLLDWEYYPSLVTFSPDGRHLAGVNGCKLRLWEVGSGRPVREMAGDAPNGEPPFFSPDGGRIATPQGVAGLS